MAQMSARKIWRLFDFLCAWPLINMQRTSKSGGNCFLAIEILGANHEMCLLVPARVFEFAE